MVPSVSRNWRVLALSLAGLIAAVGAVFFLSLGGGSYDVGVQVSPPEEDSVGLEIATTGVVPENGALKILALPRAMGNQGQDLSNGAYFTYPVIFNLDVAAGEATVEVPGSSVRGAIPAQVTLGGSIGNYPFDTYSASLFASASTSSSSESVSFVLSEAGKAVSGFDIDGSRIGFLSGDESPLALQQDQEAGYGVIEWRISRSSSTQFIAILLAAIMVAGAVISLLMTWVIVRGSRPPSVAIMVWLAVFLFALFQIRRQLPGDPPAGIDLDRFIFYPVILTLILLVVVNLISWSTREDWDLENPASVPDPQVAHERVDRDA